MQSRSIRHIAFFLAAFVVISFCVVDASGQTRKKRRPRRVKRPVITNPAIYEPATAAKTTPEATVGEDKIISTADETLGTDPAAEKASDPEDVQKTIDKLTSQVDKLTDKLLQLEEKDTAKDEKDTAKLDLERLVRAEQRAEALRAQLIDVESKLGDLHVRLEGVEYSLKPENIEKVTQGVGTVHPEEARDARRRQLESEKSRLQSQIKLLETSRARLEPSIAFADSEVDLLRARIQQQRDNERAQPPRTESRPATTRKKP